MTQPQGTVEHINPPGLLQSPAFSQVVAVTGADALVEIEATAVVPPSAES